MSELEELAQLIYREGAYCGDCGYGGWIMCADCRSVCRGYAEGVLAAGYSKLPVIHDVDWALDVLQKCGIKTADQFDALVAVQKLVPGTGFPPTPLRKNKVG